MELQSELMGSRVPPFSSCLLPGVNRTDSPTLRPLPRRSPLPFSYLPLTGTHGHCSLEWDSLEGVVSYCISKISTFNITLNTYNTFLFLNKQVKSSLWNNAAQVHEGSTEVLHPCQGQMEPAFKSNAFSFWLQHPHFCVLFFVITPSPAPSF